MDCNARLGAAIAAFAVSCLCVVGLVGCRTAAVEPPDAGPSPQATAEPAPLAPTTTGGTTGTASGGDGGAPPEPMRSDRGLSPDLPREQGSKESGRESRELGGFVLQAVIRAGEGAAPPKAPEVNVAAVESARRRTEARLTIEVSQNRARFVMSGGFVLPQGTELRARADRYGHLVLWPGDETYRVAEPGALRALLGERRLDVAPLSRAEVATTGEGQQRLNMRTRRLDVSARAAKATLEMAAFRDAGEGGMLVCRLLYDLMSAMPPSTAACAIDEVPLHADIRWTTRGALTFDVTSVAKRSDLPATDLAAPPAGSTFVTSPPPAEMAEALLPKSELAAFRTGPVDVPGSVRDAQAAVPDSGLLLVNTSDELRVAWLDGVAVAWVAPGGRLSLPSLPRGRYVLQWRTFLGDGWEPPEPIVVPGTSEVSPSRALAP